MQTAAQEVRFVLKAEEAKPLSVFIEPWADEFTVPRDESVVVTFRETTPEAAPHAVVEWHEWGVLVWAEVGMVERTVTSQDGSVLIANDPEMSRLLGFAEEMTFGHPAQPTREARRKRR
jgi:hypothetical protein